jgi:hypothetical protein
MFSWHVLLVALCFWNLFTNLLEAVPAVANVGPCAACGVPLGVIVPTNTDYTRMYEYLNTGTYSSDHSSSEM